MDHEWGRYIGGLGVDDSGVDMGGQNEGWNKRIKNHTWILYVIFA